MLTKFLKYSLFSVGLTFAIGYGFFITPENNADGISLSVLNAKAQSNGEGSGVAMIIEMDGVTITAKSTAGLSTQELQYLIAMQMLAKGYQIEWTSNGLKGTPSSSGYTTSNPNPYTGMFWQVGNVTKTRTFAGGLTGVSIMGNGVNWNNNQHSITYPSKDCVDGWYACPVKYWF